MPPSFRLPSPETALWVTMGSAMAATPQQPHDRSFRIFRMIARLAPGASLAQAQAQATAVMQRLAHDHPDTNKDVPLTLQSLRNHLLGATPEILWLLFGAVALVLLIACANVASLSLARTSTRGRELAVRIALGARPSRIVRQLLTESLVLSIIGGGLGVLLALWGVDGLKLIGPRDVPRLDEVGVDGIVVAVAGALSIGSALAFGLLPAWMASRGRFGEVVHGARGITASRGSSRLHGALVVVEVALSLVLLIAASLCLRSFTRLTSVPLGLEPEHILTFMMSPTPRHADAAAQAALYQQALDRVAAQPGVDAVGGANAQAPVSLQRGTGFAIGDEPANGGGDRFAAFVGCTRDYFRALGTTVVRGRAFTVEDRAEAPLVAIVNRSFANRLYPHGDAVGQKLRLVNPTQAQTPRTIVGVVDDVKYQGLDMDSPDTIYTPYAQTPFPWIYVAVRTHGEPLALAGAVKRAVAELDPSQPVLRIEPMRALIHESVAQPRFQLTLVALFAVLALVLALVGLYGVIAYLVAQRTQEIGIRIALGAQRRDVLRLVVGRGLGLTVAGAAIGVGVALATTHLLRAMLFQESPTDPLVFVSVPLAFAAVSLFASWLPARRAASVDPMIALRDE
jgi:predicted permease